MEKYLIEVLLYLPIALFIINCLLSKYIFKEKEVTVKEVLSILLICFVPIFNILITLWCIIDNVKRPKILDKELW